MGTLSRLPRFLRPARVRALSYRWPHFLNQLDVARREEILLFSEGDHTSPLWPNCAGKKILYFNDQRHRYVFRRLLHQEGLSLLNYVYRGDAPTEQRNGCVTVLGDVELPALRRGHFDLVICPFVLEDFAFVATFVPIVSRYLENGARVIFSVRHPYVDHMLLNQNPGSAQTSERGMTDYFTLLKANQLFTEDLREGVVDLALKAFFTDLEHDYYHEYKNTPITLHFRAVKFSRRKV